MTPWWSRPTADDPSEEEELLEPLSEEEEEEVLVSAAETSDNDDSEGEAEADTDADSEAAAAAEEKPKRRRRRPRSRSARPAEDGNGDEAPVEESTAAVEPVAAKPRSAKDEEAPAAKEEKPSAKEEKPAAKEEKPAARSTGRSTGKTTAPLATTPPAVPAAAVASGSVTLTIEQLRELTRESVIAVPDRAASSADDELKMALFCDLENIALGVRDSDKMKFEVELVLERLVDKGKIIVKKAYADWNRYSDYKRAFHGAAIEMIDIPQKHYSGKNSADIKMVVDAMDLCYAKEHLDTFVLLSGDSDFSPLVSKLKENNKTVIGVGVKNSTSALLIANCDEFLYYEDIWRDAQKGPPLAGLSEKATEVFALLIDAIQALERENKTVLWGSMIKQTMQRKRPSFNEGYYGYSTFSELLQDAEKHKVVKLRKDQRSGSLVVTGLG